jgi:hypothetical protein
MCIWTTSRASSSERVGLLFPVGFFVSFSDLSMLQILRRRGEARNSMH